MNNIIIIDHYDSFVFNLYRYVIELGSSAKVISCDSQSAVDIMALKPSHLIFSPGPCGPDETGVSLELMQLALGKVPILGVCLGALVLYKLCGGNIEKALVPRHGRSILLEYSNDDIFLGMSKFIEVGLYHSLMMGRVIPSELKGLSWCEDKQIMVVKHCKFFAYGVQFHPESILTLQGKILLANFLRISY